VENYDDSVENIIVKLTDFGLVKILQSEKLPNQMDKKNGEVESSIVGKNEFVSISGLVIGTEGYMSPEQEHKIDDTVDKDSDIFSFGIVLCELITGKIPFENGFIESDESLARYITDFLNTREGCPSVLISLVAECLKYRPSDRWKGRKQTNNFNNFFTIEEELKTIYYEKTGKEYRDITRIIEKFDLFIENPYLRYGFKGVSLLTLGKNEKSIKYFDTALKIDPNAIEVYNNKGVVLERLSRYEEAIACYNLGIQLNPNYSPLHHNKGISLRKLDDPTIAIGCFDKAISLDPSYSKAFYMKGMCLVDLGKFEDLTLECFNNAIKFNPNYAAAHYQKGIVLAQMKRNDEAIQCFDNAIQCQSDYIRVFDSKGNVLSSMGRYDEAIQCFEEAIKLEPDNAITYMNKGVTLGILKRYDEAIQCFDKTIDLDPNIAAVYYNKSNALAGLEKYEEAWENYKKYQELNKKKSNQSATKYVAQAIFK